MMIIAVLGTNVANKGAELMQCAISRHFESYKETQLCVPMEFGSFDERSRHSMRTLVIRHRRWWRMAGLAFISASTRKAIGAVLEKDVSAYVDASGFAFGDQHPVTRSEAFATFAERCARAGKKLILMPQALGPFRRRDIRNAFSRIMRASTLVYARETVSFQHAQEVGTCAEKLRIAPDFTNLLQVCTEDEIGSLDRACIVPNQRMIDKAVSSDVAAAYVPLMGDLVRRVAKHTQPVVLLHGDDDHPLVDAIAKECGCAIPVLAETDPLRIKREIGLSRLTVGSRFHSLVSSLSQGVPAIGTSWSHKYQMLFQDYGCPEMLLPARPDAEQIDECLRLGLGAGRSEQVSRLKEYSQILKRQAEAMWQEVDHTLGIA